MRIKMTTQREVFSSTAAPKESSVSNLSFEATDMSEKRAGPDSRLAMNTEKQPGVHFGRPMVPVETPDGTVNAIVMSDSATDIHAGVTRNPGYKTPSHVYAWDYSTRYVSDMFGTNIPLKVNDRILDYLSYFYFFHCHLLVKLVCKMPLDRSDRFYVNWSDQSNPLSKDGVGFEWCPLEKNEIYVLLPYSAPFPLADKTIPLDTLFGYLGISTIGSNGSTVVIDAYTTLVDITTYNLRPVDKPSESTPVTVSAGGDVPAGTWTYALVSYTGTRVPEVLENIFIVPNDGGSPVTLFTLEGSPIAVSRTSETITTEGAKIYAAEEAASLQVVFYPADTEIAEEQMQDIELPGQTTEDGNMTDLTGHTPDMAPTKKTETVYGQNRVEAVRETNQFYLCATESMDGATTKEFTITPPEGLLINYARHQLWTRYPRVKLTGTQTIQNPARFRIVQVPRYGDLTFSGPQFFELPGVEWDPKDGDLNLELYWDRPDVSFEYDRTQTLLENFAAFLPRIVIQPINNYGNAVPVNLFLSVDHSSYHAVKDITLDSTRNDTRPDLDQAEEQIKMPQYTHCCARRCALNPTFTSDYPCCRACNAHTACKCDCECFQAKNELLYGHHFHPYVTIDTPSLTMSQSAALDDNYVMIGSVMYNGKIYHEWTYMDEYRPPLTKDNIYGLNPVDINAVELAGSDIAELLAELNRAIHKAVAPKCRHSLCRKLFRPKATEEKEPTRPRPVSELPSQAEEQTSSYPILRTQSFASRVAAVACKVAATAAIMAFPFSKEEEEIAEEQINTQGGTQFQTPVGMLPSDEGNNAIADTWAYVDTFDLEVTSADPTPSASIAIDANALGPYVRQEAKRHALWRGNLKFKFLINTPRTVAGACTVAHVDEDYATQPSNYILRQYPHQTTMDNSPLDITVDWRLKNPYATRSGNNGYLYITFNGGAYATGTNLVKVTMYVDASGIEFARPTSPVSLPTQRIFHIPPTRTIPLKDVSLATVARTLQDGLKDHRVSAEEAKMVHDAGFYFDTTNRYLTCPSCRLSVVDWEREDTFLGEHERHARQLRLPCPLLAERRRQHGRRFEKSQPLFDALNRAWTTYDMKNDTW